MAAEALAIYCNPARNLYVTLVRDIQNLRHHLGLAVSARHVEMVETFADSALDDGGFMDHMIAGLSQCLFTLLAGRIA